MSKNCLVTKLKGTVNADLEKLDVLTLAVSPSLSSLELDIRRYVGHEMSWDGDVVVTLGGVQQTSPITITNTVYVTSGSNGGTIEIDGKYSMDGNAGNNSNMLRNELHPKYFDTLTAMASWWVGSFSSSTQSLPDDAWHLKGVLSDIAGFKNKSTIANIALVKCGISGNLSDLPLLTQVTSLALAFNQGVTGSLSSIGGWTGLTNLNLSSTSVTGTVESLVTAQRTAGRTTGSIKIYAENTSITYNGSAAGTHTYTWDAQGNITVS